MDSLPPNSTSPLQPSPSPSLSDQLTIETPEQTALEFSIAGIGSRFLALAIDTLIQAAAVALIGIAVAIFFSSSNFARYGPWIGAIALLLLFLIFYGYFMLFEAIWNGQTPGKRAIRIRVIKEDGRPMQTIESVGRNLLRIVDQVPFFYAVGIASVLLSKKGKRLGDFVAGTIVVHERALEDIKPTWEAAAATGGGGAGVKVRSQRLTPEELALVEAFLNRRHALAPDVRFNTAAQIVWRLRPKLEIPEGSNPRDEELLEAVAAEQRASAKYA